MKNLTATQCFLLWYDIQGKLKISDSFPVQRGEPYDTGGLSAASWRYTKHAFSFASGYIRHVSLSNENVQIVHPGHRTKIEARWGPVYTQNAEHLTTHADKLRNTLQSIRIFKQLGSNIKGFAPPPFVQICLCAQCEWVFIGSQYGRGCEDLH